MARESYTSPRKDSERIAQMLRSIVQDGTKAFKKNTIDVMFPKKIVDGKDIGEVSRRWIMTICGSLQNEEEKIEQLLLAVWCFYQDGVNIDEDEIWHLKWLKDGIPLFMKKVNDLPGTGRVAPMASLEKPPKKDDIEWWKPE